MSEGIKFTRNGVTLTLASNGKVFEGDNTVRGNWRTQPKEGETKNRIYYDLQDMGTMGLDVDYQFNLKNQLETRIRVDGTDITDSNPYTFLGKIEIDDDKDIVYRLISTEGINLSHSIYLFGNLSVESVSRLNLDLEGGGTLIIYGRNKPNEIPIKVGENEIGDANEGLDKLSFDAVTENVLNFGGIELPTYETAEIDINGEWTVQDTKLAFIARKGSGKTAIVFAGNYKAVSAGIAYMMEDDNQTIAFTIEGKHKFKAGEAKWDLAIGYTAKADKSKRLKATASAEFKQGAGRSLTIDGALTIEESSGAKKTIDLSLDAKYEFNGNTIAIKASYKDKEDNTKEYNIEIAGDIELEGVGKFVLRASATTGIGESLSIDFEGENDSIFRRLNIKLTRDPNGKIKWSFAFKFQFTWVNGHLTVQNPKELNALNNPD